MDLDNLERIVDAWLGGTIGDEEFVRLHAALDGSYGVDAEGERVWLGRQVDNPAYVDTLYLSDDISDEQLERLEQLIGEYE